MNQRLRRQIVGTGAAALTLAGLLAGCSHSGTSGGAGGGGGGDTVATVGGDSISRHDLDSTLEAADGENILRQLIDYQLLLQELKKKNLSITESEVQAEIERGRQNNPAVAAIIQAGGSKVEALERQIKERLAVARLLTVDVKVDDKELQTWYDKHRAYYSEPARVKLGVLLTSTKVRADTMEQQLKTKSKSFKELVDEQHAANDPAARGSMMTSPREVEMERLEDAVAKAVTNLKQSELTGVLPVGQPGQKAFAIFQLVQRIDAKAPTLAQVRPTAEIDCKLDKVVRKLVTGTPGAPKYDSLVQRVRDSVAQQSGGRPSYRQILDVIDQQAVESLMSRLRTGSPVTVTDTAFARVADVYKTGGASGGAARAPRPGGPARRPAANR